MQVRLGSRFHTCEAAARAHDRACIACLGRGSGALLNYPVAAYPDSVCPPSTMSSLAQACGLPAICQCKPGLGLALLALNSSCCAPLCSDQGQQALVSSVSRSGTLACARQPAESLSCACLAGRPGHRGAARSAWQSGPH